MNTAKITFLYLLSLVALIFGSIALGNILFALIDKNIPDVLYKFYYSSGDLKFAIASLLVSAPVYLFTVSQITRNMISGAISADAPIRRWLSYLILLITSIVETGWIIAVIYNFLDGALTLRFALKSLVALGLSGFIFSYYFLDIKKEDAFKGHKMYFYSALALVIASLAAGIFFVESPKEARARKLDTLIINDFSMIDGALNNYWSNNQKLPASLKELTGTATYLIPSDTKDKTRDEEYSYRVISDDRYEICAYFNASSKDAEQYETENWPHNIGRQCFEKNIRKDMGKDVMIPVRQGNSN